MIFGSQLVGVPHHCEADEAQIYNNLGIGTPM